MPRIGLVSLSMRLLIASCAFGSTAFAQQEYAQFAGTYKGAASGCRGPGAGADVAIVVESDGHIHGASRYVGGTDAIDGTIYPGGLVKATWGRTSLQDGKFQNGELTGWVQAGGCKLTFDLKREN
ncbi:MAG: hypothetical protein ACLQME_25125 [Alphaproteobacteria bacterium]